MVLPADANSPEQGGSGTPAEEWPHAAAAELLKRVKSVAQQIAERVRHVVDETATNHAPLPTDPTEEQPPVE